MIVALLLIDPEDSTESIWKDAIINGPIVVGAEVEFKFTDDPEHQHRRKIVKWVRTGPSGKKEVGVWATRPEGVKIKPLWKTGWALLSYASPSTIQVGDVTSENYIEVHTPGDMPGLYLDEACPSRRVRRGAFGLTYESVGDILEDGWEPISVGDYVGGSLGYGRLLSFKKLIKYNPGRYLDAEEIDSSGAAPIG